MADLDLTEAIEAAERVMAEGFVWRIDDKTRREIAEAAVRAAAPIIERAVREQVAADLEATFVTGAVPPEWAQAGGKPTARGIRVWAVGVALNGVPDA